MIELVSGNLNLTFAVQNFRYGIFSYRNSGKNFLRAVSRNADGGFGIHKTEYACFFLHPFVFILCLNDDINRCHSRSGSVIRRNRLLNGDASGCGGVSVGYGKCCFITLGYRTAGCHITGSAYKLRYIETCR